MDSLQKQFSESKSAADFGTRYIGYLSGLLANLDMVVIASIIDTIELAGKKGRTIFIIGNGGSAASASHFANDLCVGTRADGHAHLKAVSLTDNVALMTALANDEGYEKIFSRQLEGGVRPGDILIALSVSGNSQNIIEAIEYAKDNGVVTIGISGFDGGQLDSLSDIALTIPTHHGEYGPVEDIFTIIGHLIYSFLKMKRRGERLNTQVDSFVYEKGVCVENS